MENAAERSGDGGYRPSQVSRQRMLTILIREGCDDIARYQELTPTDWVPYYAISCKRYPSIIQYTLEHGTASSLRIILEMSLYTPEQLAWAVYNTDNPELIEVLLSCDAVTRILERYRDETFKWLVSIVEDDRYHSCENVKLAVERMPALVAGTPVIDNGHVFGINSLCPHCRDIIYPFAAEGVMAVDLEARFYACMYNIKYAALGSVGWYMGDDFTIGRIFGLMLDFYKGKMPNSEIMSLMNQKMNVWHKLLTDRNMHLNGNDYVTEVLRYRTDIRVTLPEMANVMRRYGIISDYTYVYALNQSACVAMYRTCPTTVNIDVDNIVNFECIKKVPEIIKLLPVERARTMLADLAERCSYSLCTMHDWINSTFPWEMMHNARLRDAVEERRSYNAGARQLAAQHGRCIEKILLMCQRRKDNLVASLDRNVIRNIAKWI